MADTDLIARLYPVYENYLGRNTLKKNQDRFRRGLPFPDDSPRQKQRDPALGQHDRELTQPPQDRNPDDYLDCLELRFSNGPKTNRGFVFGRDEKCDIVLPAVLMSVSNFHCALTFENDFDDSDEYRVVLRDLGSTSGTVVEYRDQGGEPRRRFRWILSGHRGPHDATITIQLDSILVFRIVVNIPRSSHAVVDSINNFLRQRPPESLFAGLDLYVPPRTEAATGAHTPNSGPILLNIKELGRGAFGVATHCWDVSTGREFARKQPLKPLCEEGRRAWREEAKLLSKLSHVRASKTSPICYSKCSIANFDQEHIVRIFAFVATPSSVYGNEAQAVELQLECVLGGTLDQRLPLPYLECLEVTRQGLSALAYLHGHSPPIVHRDIKPQNILVKDGPEGICIKLADFGLSREKRSLLTICGTRRYFAPEIAEEEVWRKNGGSSRSYSPAVDIWSLGVVAFECLSGGLPRSSARGTDWCKAIVDDILSMGPPNHRGLHHLLLSYMVVINSKVRGSAQVCYDEVVLLATTQKSSLETSADFSLAFSPESSLQEDRQSALATISNAPRQSVATGADHDKRCLLPSLRPLPGLRPRNGLRPLPPIRIDEHVIPQTVEHDSEGEDTATGPRVSTRSSDDRSGATTRTFPSSAVSPKASRRRTSEYSASATITPKRITRPSHSPSPSGRQHTTGHNSTRRGSASTHTRGSSRHLVLPEDLFSEEEGAESGYLATNPLLDPLVVGSEVAMLGRESASSFGTAQTGSRSVPRSVPQSVPQSGADKSSVVLRDDWLYKPVSKD